MDFGPFPGLLGSVYDAWILGSCRPNDCRGSILAVLVVEVILVREPRLLRQISPTRTEGGAFPWWIRKARLMADNWMTSASWGIRPGPGPD